MAFFLEALNMGLDSLFSKSEKKLNWALQPSSCQSCHSFWIGCSKCGRSLSLASGFHSSPFLSIVNLNNHSKIKLREFPYLKLSSYCLLNNMKILQWTWRHWAPCCSQHIQFPQCPCHFLPFGLLGPASPVPSLHGSAPVTPSVWKAFLHPTLCSKRTS